MTEIWKFKIEKAEGDIEIEMPALSEILCVQAQDDQPCIWAKVFTDAGINRVKRIFQVFGTGHEMPGITKRREYIGTFQLFNGRYVYHLFELKQ